MSRHFLVSGRVQGVGYRAFVRREASALGLKGGVRNLDDGRVELVAIAESGASGEAKLAALQAALRRGPSHSQVTSLDERAAPSTGEWPTDEFSILEDGVSEWR